MKAILIASAIVFGMAGFTAAFAQDKPTNRMAICGAEWRAEKAKPDFVKPEKGQGMAAWQAFRKECFVRHPAPAKTAKN